MEEIIKKTYEFLKKELAKSEYYQDNNQRSIQYRLEHSVRVMNIGKTIALEEGFDVNKMMVACLLHDIGYSIEYKEKKDFLEHGRIGAKISKDFILSLGFSEKDCQEMCYGIAIHVDDKADFIHENTAFAKSIGDADNIDRFDAFRLYEGLQNADYCNLSLEEQRALCNKYINGLTKFLDLELGTKTAKRLWVEKINYQIEFYRRLLNQVDNSVI